MHSIRYLLEYFNYSLSVLSCTDYRSSLNLEIFQSLIHPSLKNLILRTLYLNFELFNNSTLLFGNPFRSSCYLWYFKTCHFFLFDCFIQPLLCLFFDNQFSRLSLVLFLAWISWKLADLLFCFFGQWFSFSFFDLLPGHFFFELRSVDLLSLWYHLMLYSSNSLTHVAIITCCKLKLWLESEKLRFIMKARTRSKFKNFAKLKTLFEKFRGSGQHFFYINIINNTILKLSF